MRGMYTAGVLDVFLDNDIKVDCIVGVSAGALFGPNFLSKQKGRVIRYNKRFNGVKNYMGLAPMLREGSVVNTRMAYGEIPQRLDRFDDETFIASDVPFYAVVTNVASGQPEYIRINSVFEQMDVLRASASMPFVSKPVEINGEKYLDGGVSDSIPFKWMQQQGAEKIVVVLTRDASYRKSPMSHVSLELYGLKYPAIAKRLENRHNDYNTSLELLRQKELAGDVFVIRPSVPITLEQLEKDPEKLQETYDIGQKDAAAIMPKLKEYLA